MPAKIKTAPRVNNSKATYHLVEVATSPEARAVSRRQKREVSSLAGESTQARLCGCGFRVSLGFFWILIDCRQIGLIDFGPELWQTRCLQGQCSIIWGPKWRVVLWSGWPPLENFFISIFLNLFCLQNYLSNKYEAVILASIERKGYLPCSIDE